MKHTRYCPTRQAYPPPQPPTHVRTPYYSPIERHRNCEYRHSQYEHMTITYGLQHTSRWKLYLNMTSRDLCHGSDAAHTAAFVPIKMCNRKEEVMYFDLTSSIRGIYLPLKIQAEMGSPGLCCYIWIDFHIAETLKVWNLSMWVSEGVTYTDTYPTTRKLHRTFGLRAESGKSLVLNVKEIYDLMSIPDGLRHPEKVMFYPNNLVSLEDSHLIHVSNSKRKPSQPFQRI